MVPTQCSNESFILFLFFFPFLFLLVARFPRNRRFRGESKVKNLLFACFIEVQEEISNESFLSNIALHTLAEWYICNAATKL